MSNTNFEGRPGGASRGQDNQQSYQVNKKTPLGDVQRGGNPATTDQDDEHEGATEQQVSDRSGSAKAVNLIIEGVSLLANERAEIGAMLDAQGGDINGLIAQLNRR